MDDYMKLLFECRMDQFPAVGSEELNCEKVLSDMQWSRSNAVRGLIAIELTVSN